MNKYNIIGYLLIFIALWTTVSSFYILFFQAR